MNLVKADNTVVGNVKDIGESQPMKMKLLRENVRSGDCVQVDYYEQCWSACGNIQRRIKNCELCTIASVCFVQSEGIASFYVKFVKEGLEDEAMDTEISMLAAEFEKNKIGAWKIFHDSDKNDVDIVEL